MTTVADIIITVAAVMGAVVTILGVIFAAYRWYMKMEHIGSEISHIKDENAVLCFALSACLDGLVQLGANHNVPVAKDKLDKYLNKQAHK
jgi:hypothetical protein|nr:MAG TPA: hypothetical protein [Caudoviricetes sp.]